MVWFPEYPCPLRYSPDSRSPLESGLVASSMAESACSAPFKLQWSLVPLSVIVSASSGAYLVGCG